jgi:hypothetical protein
VRFAIGSAATIDAFVVPLHRNGPLELAVALRPGLVNRIPSSAVAFARGRYERAARTSSSWCGSHRLQRIVPAQPRNHGCHSLRDSRGCAGSERRCTRATSATRRTEGGGPRCGASAAASHAAFVFKRGESISTRPNAQGRRTEYLSSTGSGPPGGCGAGGGGACPGGARAGGLPFASPDVFRAIKKSNGSPWRAALSRSHAKRLNSFAAHGRGGRCSRSRARGLRRGRRRRISGEFLDGAVFLDDRRLACRRAHTHADLACLAEPRVHVVTCRAKRLHRSRRAGARSRVLRVRVRVAVAPTLESGGWPDLTVFSEQRELRRLARPFRRHTSRQRDAQGARALAVTCGRWGGGTINCCRGRGGEGVARGP